MLTDRGKKLFWTVGLAAACAAGMAPWLMTKVIVTEPGYNTVVVHAPLIGEYSYEKDVLPPGRSMVWVYSFGIPVKMSAETSLVSSEEVVTEGGKSVVITAKVKIRVTDPYVLISSFGEHWHKDVALPLMEERLAAYARNQSSGIFEQALKGSQGAPFGILSDIQDAFTSRGLPLEVSDTSIEYVEYPSTNNARYVLDADAKKWLHNPRYSR